MIQAEAEQKLAIAENTLKGWHVLLIMLGFFGVMFAVNGVFLYHAITSFPGEDVEKSYVQGLNYNDTLAARATQLELGWTAEAGWQDDALVFRLRDADGVPLSNLSVVGEIRRLATRDADKSLVFRAKPGGEYTVDDASLAPGQWLLRINVMDSNAETVLLIVNKTLIVS